MRFMILVMGDERAALDNTQAQDEQIIAAYARYAEDLKKAGVLLGGEALLPSENGARVVVANGTRLVTDGPFSEAKELIGGYFLIDAKSKDEAIEWASRCPAAHFPGRGFAEVREVMVLDH
jgi:hypothetical protein